MREVEFLKMLSEADYVEMFEVIDDDGIRKPAVRANTMPSSFSDPVHDIKNIRLTVDWRLLNKWQDESEKLRRRRKNEL